MSIWSLTGKSGTACDQAAMNIFFSLEWDKLSYEGGSNNEIFVQCIFVRYLWKDMTENSSHNSQDCNINQSYQHGTCRCRYKSILKKEKEEIFNGTLLIKLQNIVYFGNLWNIQWYFIWDECMIKHSCIMSIFVQGWYNQWM